MEIVATENIPKAEDVPLDNLMKVYKVCLEMAMLTLKQEGVGLACPQIGMPWNLFIIRNSDCFEYYINCEYQPLVDQKDFESIEGCLSLRNLDGSFKRFLVKRFSKIRVIGNRLLDRDKLALEDVDMEISGYLAVIFQHELDHNLGIEGLISNIGKELSDVKQTAIG